MASPGLGASDPTLGFHADVFHGTFLHMAAVDPDRTLGTGGHRDHRAVLAIGTLVEVGLSAMRAIANDEPPSAQKARKVKREWLQVEFPKFLASVIAAGGIYRILAA